MHTSTKPEAAPAAEQLSDDARYLLRYLNRNANVYNSVIRLHSGKHVLVPPPGFQWSKRVNQMKTVTRPACLLELVEKGLMKISESRRANNGDNKVTYTLTQKGKHLGKELISQ